ncbi:tRNA (guanosine(37)-N1)-methyltransferase TrmD [bacterium]|nr:tRNA (guanosine(37)-N1)-methyltransferase TrmD [bacterium]
MRIDILTLFPKMFQGPLDESILGRAKKAGLVEINIHDIRQFTHNRHLKADDRPYGGGPGMVMKPQPIFEGVEFICSRAGQPRIILMSPQGKTFSQEKAMELAKESNLLFICGHYEGIDERVRQKLITDELSIGDYVLTGGELPAMVVIDALVRLIPGVLGKGESVRRDSFYQQLLDFPHYTRPPVYLGMRAPQVLLSGNHCEIQNWRRREAIRQTFLRRPDLLKQANLTEEDKRFLKEVKGERDGCD